MAVQPKLLRIVVADVDVPVRLSDVPLPVREAIVMGVKSTRVDNTSTAYLGPSATNGSQLLPVFPGGQTLLKETDLSDWYVDAGTADDELNIYYW